MAHPHVPSFLQEIVDATNDLVCAYKPNLAFFEAMGLEGMQVMLESLRAVPKHIPIIADAKRGDIGNTARFYAKALFDIYKFDAVHGEPLRRPRARPALHRLHATEASSSGAAARTPAPRTCRT